MRKLFVILFLCLSYYSGFSQDDIEYYVKFGVGQSLAKPCDDGQNDCTYPGGYNLQTSFVATIDDGVEEKNISSNSIVYQPKGNILYVSLSGTAKITWVKTCDNGTTTEIDELVTFEEEIVDSINLNTYTKSVTITRKLIKVEGACTRTHELVLFVYILPYKTVGLNLGSKLCTQDIISLESLESQDYHKWYAKINGGNWIDLGLSTNTSIQNIEVKKIYDLAGIDAKLNDQIMFLIDHGFSPYLLDQNPISSWKIVYPSPDVPESVFTSNSPSCVGGINGSISVGLINGNSPTYYKYSLHKVYYQETKPENCDKYIGSVNVPEQIPADSGDWYCVTAEGGNFTFIDDNTVEDQLLSLETITSGGLTKIGAGDWLVYIKQDDTTVMCENKYIKHISDPLQPELKSIIIPEYTYSNSKYNLLYKEASANVIFNYENGTTNNDIIIDNRPPVIGGENSGSVGGLTAGTYGLKINDNKGCPFKIPDITEKLEGGEFTLTPPGPLSFDDSTKNQVSCYHDNDGEYQFVVSGGVGLYEITVGSETLFTQDSPTEDLAYKLKFENLAYGSHPYSIKTENYDGEILSGTIFIEEPDPLILWIDTIKNPICSPIPDGEIKFHGGGGNPIYDFFLNEVERISDKNETNVDSIGGLYINIDYTLRIKDTKACITEFDFRMNDFANPLEFYVLDTFPAKCIGGNTGLINIKTHGGHDDTYSISDFMGFEFQDINKLNDSIFEISKLESEEDYDVILKDSENCLYLQNINIEPNPSPVFPQIIDSMEIQCNSYNNGWIEVKGAQGDTLPGGYDYFLSDEDPFTTNKIDLGDTSLVKSGDKTKFYNLTPGQHTVYVSDTNDCLNSAVQATRDVYKTNFFVYEPDTIKVSYDNTGVSEKGKTDAKLWFTAKGGNESYHFELESADTLVASGSTSDSILIDNLAEGLYSLKIKDSCDCINGGVNLDWIKYSGIRIKSPNEILTLHAGTVNPTSCFAGNNGSVNIYGEGGWEGTGYIYGIDSVDIEDNQGIFENLASGWYLFHVKDSSNVIVYDSIYVPQPNLLEASIKDITDVQCHNGFDGEISLSVIGGIMPYEFSNDGSTWQMDSVFTALAKNNYTLHVRDMKECETTVAAEINHPEPYSVSYTVTETLCGEANGSINCGVLGGTAPYTFQWTYEDRSVGTESLLNNLYSGEYYVAIRDAHSCDTSFIVVVSNTDGPQVDFEFIDTVSCIGQSDGAIHYNVSEGTTPYNIKLYTGSNLVQETQIALSGSYVFENLESNTYNIVVNDFNSCYGTINTIILPEPESIGLIADIIADPVCYGYSNGEISVHATGGNGDYKYQWSTGESSNEIDNLFFGTYSVSAIDSKGCISESTYKLINPEKLSVDIGDDEIICEGQVYPLSAQGFNTYNWVFNGEYISSASEIEVWAAGEYVLQVSDSKGCLAEDTFHLSISNDLLEAEFLMPSEVHENDTVVAIDISWPEPDNVEWSFSSGIIEINSDAYLEEFTFIGPGIYTVSLTSFKAMCVDSISKQIIVLADTSSMEKSMLGANPLIKTFKVFPNPNNGQFSAQVELDYTTDITIDLYNIQQNRLVFRQNASGQSNYNMEYGFTNLQQGVYLVILYVENEKRSEKVIVF